MRMINNGMNYKLKTNNMTVEQQLKRLDDYINWIKIDENYQIMKEFLFMYQSEYIEFIERTKWLMQKYIGTENYDKIFDNRTKNILNKIESLIQNK